MAIYILMANRACHLCSIGHIDNTTKTSVCKAWHATARPVHFASAYHAAAMSRATMSHLPASPPYGVNGLRLHLASADTACSAFAHIPQHVPMQGTTRPRQRGGCVAPSCGMTILRRLGKIGLDSREKPNPKGARQSLRSSPRV